MKKSALFILFALISVAGFSQITGWNAKVGMNISNYTGDADLNAKIGFKLGGINEDNLLEIKDFGFGGAVVLGDLWNKFDACLDQNYLAVIEHFKKLKKLAD